MIEELALATQWQALQNEVQHDMADELPTHIPPHLLRLYNQLDWVGQDLDHLSHHLQQDVSSLTGQLMELELLGFAPSKPACIYVVVRINKVHNRHFLF